MKVNVNKLVKIKPINGIADFLALGLFGYRNGWSPEDVAAAVESDTGIPRTVLTSAYVIDNTASLNVVAVQPVSSHGRSKRYLTVDHSHGGFSPKVAVVKKVPMYKDARGDIFINENDM